MIYCMVGISGSGKTTLVNNMVKYLEDTVIVSRDRLREMLFGYTPENVQEYYGRNDIDANEKLVTRMQDVLIKKAINQGKDILIDNTHLQIKYIDALKQYSTHIKFVLVDVPLETALSRDLVRVKSVGGSVIKNQFEQLVQLKKVFDFKDWVPEKPEQLGTRKALGGWNAFIFDLDGTLALNKAGRSPYDWSRVDEDDVNEPVKRVLRTIEDFGYKIILCSGRSDACRQKTLDWLSAHGIHHNELHMRKHDDNRKDSVIKEEMWRELTMRYNIIGMFDDRNQVVEHGRELGFTVFQVAEGDF